MFLLVIVLGQNAYCIMHIPIFIYDVSLIVSTKCHLYKPMKNKNLSHCILFMIF